MPHDSGCTGVSFRRESGRVLPSGTLRAFQASRTPDLGSARPGLLERRRRLEAPPRRRAAPCAVRIVYAQSFLLRRGSRSAFRRGYGAVAPGVAAQVPRQEQKLMEFAPLVDLARAQQARARARSDVADLFEARARTG